MEQRNLSIESHLNRTDTVWEISTFRFALFLDLLNFIYSPLNMELI